MLPGILRESAVVELVYLGSGKILQAYLEETCRQTRRAMPPAQ